ncbi:MAG: trehalose-phosphatase [Thermomicrobiales bacterium]|nr:trehalose-phosphatase [Thermomicrobiales bacterium]
MSSANLDLAIDACFKALSAAPSGLFTDFDGTLSQVAPTPAEAHLAKGADIALRRLVACVDTVAIVTGRAASDALERVPVHGLRYVGNHGLEEIVDGESAIQPEAERQVASIAAAMTHLERAVEERGRRDGLVFENKTLSASIHYRLAPDQEAAFSLLLPLVEAQAARYDLVVTQGKLVFELRPKLAINKGTAVEHLISARGLNGAIMLGDDVTDVDAFLAIRRARQSGLEGVAVAVVSEDTHRSVVDAADAYLSDVNETVLLLNALADRLEAAVR